MHAATIDKRLTNQVATTFFVALNHRYAAIPKLLLCRCKKQNSSAELVPKYRTVGPIICDRSDTGLPFQQLDSLIHDLSAIKHRNRQQIENSQTDTYQSQKLEKLTKTSFCRAAGELRNIDGATNILDRHAAGDHSAKHLEGKFSRIPGFRDRQPNRLYRPGIVDKNTDSEQTALFAVNKVGSEHRIRRLAATIAYVVNSNPVACSGGHDIDQVTKPEYDLIFNLDNAITNFQRCIFSGAVLHNAANERRRRTGQQSQAIEYDTGFS